ncbi:MAG TPA: ABC transporter substrate-binding protein [bacterium]|nr:ABC transporter substrate-binding protein [bacterium]HPN30215.1 ABC transporter substrate-binding protein [bacterium]
MKKVKLVFIIIIFLACGCQKKAEGIKPLRIAINWAGEGYILIAAEKGFFKKNGINAEIEYITDYNKRLLLFKEKKFEGTGIVLADFVSLNAEGYNSKLLYSATYSDTGDALVCGRDINSIKDLKDKTISFDGVNTFSHYFVLEILNKNGLTEKDVKFANYPPSMVLEKLEEKEIDAGHCWSPYQYAAIEKGYKILAKAGDYPGILIDGFIMDEKFVESNKDAVKRLIKSFSEAIEYINFNKKEALSIIARYFNIKDEDIENQFNGINYLTVEDNKKLFNKENEINLYVSSQKLGNFFLDRGQISDIPDFDNLIDGSFLQER